MEMAELETYLRDLHQKLKDRELTDFWVMADRKDFRTIKMSRKDMEAYLRENVAHYRGKRIAWIRCFVHPEGLKKKDMFVMSIKVIICEISEEGAIDHSPYSTYGLAVNFYPEDLQTVKFSLKLVESLLRLAAGKKKAKVETDPLNGVSLTDFKAKLRKKGLEWEFM